MMSRWVVGTGVTAAIALSFIGGFAFHTIMTLDAHSGEPRQTEIEALRQEASSFFYRTLGDLFKGTDNSRVSANALRVFGECRSRLEPRCRLMSVYPSYGVFWGEVMFPSGDWFQVGLSKTDTGGWFLDTFQHLGNDPAFHDVSLPNPP